MSEQTPRFFRIVIIGAGKGGTALLQALRHDPAVKVVGICEMDPSAAGLQLARRLEVPITRDYRKLAARPDIDVIMDVTGNADVRAGLVKLVRPGVEIMGGFSTRLLWELIEERRAGQALSERSLEEQRLLFDIGLKLSVAENLHTLFPLIVEYATRLMDAPAGSLGVWDEAAGELRLVAAKGFGQEFTSQTSWKVRKGGLTGHILNSPDPVVVPDVTKHPRFDNPLMLHEGIRALAATALHHDRRIVGILYVNYFKPREFSPHETGLLSLLATLAAMTIEKVRVAEQERLMAVTDDLTGLYNHRFFMQQIGTEVGRAVRYQRPLSLLMLDIDHFKHYNDTHGHLKGNDILRDLARLLLQACREADILARYGGEEFTMLLPETKGADGLVLAERIRHRISDHVFPGEKTQPLGRVSVSIGVAACPDHAQDTFGLIEQADRMLYQAKKQGRNCVVLAP